MKHRQQQRTCRDTEQRLPKLTINHLPDEVLLDIFDSYRRGINLYDKRWKEKHAWIRLTHVCRKWRGVVFASTSRLNLGITVGPTKPGHIKTILSSTLPIFIDYKYVNKDFGSALWRMRAALKHRDRVREISLEGIVEFEDKFFGEFFKATQCTFPVLESLSLCFGNNYQPNLPNTFLRGQDLSNLHLRRLKLERATLASISGFLLSATALTDLILQSRSVINTQIPLQPPTSKDILSLSKSTYFHFVGSSVDLDALAAGLSAPSLRDVNFKFRDEIWPPIVHLPRFNDEIEKRYYAVWMVFQQYDFSLSLRSKSEYIIQCEPSFSFGPVRKRNPESIIQMSDALSTRLTTVEVLDVSIFTRRFKVWEDFNTWRRFLRRFPSLKVFRTEGPNDYFGRVFSDMPNDDLNFLPALKEIVLSKDRSSEDECAAELVAFQSFINARQQAGHPVKVFFGNW